MWIGESVVLCGMSYRKAFGESSIEPEHLKPPQGPIQIMEWKREKGLEEGTEELGKMKAMWRKVR